MSAEKLSSYIDRLERRLRVGASLRGAAIVVAVALVATVVLAMVMNAFMFSRGSVVSARTVLLLALGVAAGLGLALPLLRLNGRRAAGRAEKAFPEFQQRLVTFAECTARGKHPMLELLAAETLPIARKADPPLLAPNRSLLASLGVALAAFGVLVWMIAAGPGYLGYGASLLWAATPRGARPLYDVRVKPGDITVRRHSDLLVTAQPIGIQTDKMRLYARYQSASKWEQVNMQPEAGASRFQFLFAGIPESVEYYVETGALQSRHFHIRVADLPSVKSIRVTYRYPPWTGLKSVIQQHGGDLRAVEGTEAELEISTDRPLRGGRLVLDNDRQIHLADGAANLYRGAIRMEKDGLYHIAGVDNGQVVRLSGDFIIAADKAAPPEVHIVRPGGDYRASPIEEVTVEVKASDQFGLNDMRLYYSVNGGPDQSVRLLGKRGQKQADGSSILRFENLKLVPGDVVSLYATAKDGHAESRTDMYFVQAEPFEREFSQSQQAGGGGAGQGDPGDISQREKEIIAATWKQEGDKSSSSSRQGAESGKFLSGVQSTLADQARSLSGRMQSRELSQENQEFNGFVAEMDAAAAAMDPAAQKLQRQEWNHAIPNEEKALQHLLRAEATFRRIEVAFGSAGGGGGAGAGRDLASLFDLELDTQKNQYETAQTASAAGQQAKNVDDALQKLDELWRRQQELAQRQANAQSVEQRWQQEMLRRNAEELQREIQQLAANQQQAGNQSGSQSASGQPGSSQASSSQSRSGQSGGKADSSIQQALDRLRQASQAMSRAASSGQSGADARRAAQQLQEAAKLLAGMQQRLASDRLNAMAREADRLSKQERDQADRLRRSLGQPNSEQQEYGQQSYGRQSYGYGRRFGRTQPDSGSQKAQSLSQERQVQADDLAALERQMRDAERDLAGDQRAASSKIRDALGDLDQSDAQTRVQKSADWARRGMNINSDSTEREIAQELQHLADQLRQAQQALGPAQQQGTASALNRIERLRNELQTLGANSGPRNAQALQQGQLSRGAQSAQGQQSRGGQPSQGAQPSQGGQPGTQVGPVGRAGDTIVGGYRDGTLYGNIDTGNNSNIRRSVAPPDTSPLPPDSEATIQQGLNDLNQLRQTVREDPEAAREVQDLIEAMKRLDPRRFPGNAALVEQLRVKLLNDVDKLELQVRRDSDANPSGQIRSSNPAVAPPGYQDAVAEYFRRLSKNH